MSNWHKYLDYDDVDDFEAAEKIEAPEGKRNDRKHTSRSEYKIKHRRVREDKE
jgi:hypothetical protein